jgi:hypothetical protein
MGKIRAHLRCFHGRQLLILLASRKGTTGGWWLLGLPGEQRGARRGEAQARAGVGPQFPNFTSITIRSPGPPCLKINAQSTSDLRLVRYGYARKEKEITFPTGPVSYPTKIQFIQNLTNKTDFQNSFLVFPSWLGAGRETMQGDVVRWFPAGGVHLGELWRKAHAPEAIVTRVRAQMANNSQ